MEEVNLCSLAVKHTEATSSCPHTTQRALFIHIHKKINIHFVISSPFCSLLRSPPHSGAKGVCVCWPRSSAGRRERVTGGHLHSWARPTRCWGFLGDGAVRPKREGKSRRAQQHHHRARALHVAAAELRPREDAHLCGAPPSLANRVPHSLHTQCSV